MNGSVEGSGDKGGKWMDAHGGNGIRRGSFEQEGVVVRCLAVVRM